MTLPATGPISMAQVATELGISQTGLSLNTTLVRQLAGVLSGAISMENLLGKAASFTGNVATTQVQQFLIAGNPNAPFFSGTLAQIGLRTNAGTQVQVETLPVSFWTSNIALINNTTGVSMTLPYLGSGVWGTPDTTGGRIIRNNANDNFTIEI